MDKIFKTAFVIDVNVVTFFSNKFRKDFNSYLKTEYKKFRFGYWGLKTILIKELFIWLWVITEYYAYNLYIKREMDDEAFSFKIIHKLFFYDVIEYDEDSISVYEWWHGYIDKRIMEKKKDFDFAYDIMDGFALKVLKRIKPNILDMEISDFNNKHLGDIERINSRTNRYLKATLFSVKEILENKFEIDVSTIFNDICSNKHVKNVIKELGKESNN